MHRGVGLPAMQQQHGDRTAIGAYRSAAACASIRSAAAGATARGQIGCDIDVEPVRLVR